MKLNLGLIFYLLALNSCSHSSLYFLSPSPLRGLSSKVETGPSCSQLLMGFLKEGDYDKASVEKLKNSFERIKLYPALIAGSKKPSWQNVQDLREIVTQLEEVERKYVFSGKQDGADLFKTIFWQNFSEGEVKTFLKRVESFSLMENPSASERELISFYQSLFLKLESFWPFKTGIKTFDLDSYKRKINAQAQKIVDDLKGKLFPTTGFKNLQEYRAAIEGGGEGDLAVLNYMIQNEEVAVAINRPSRARWWIPKVGFYNQHETGSSRGMLNQHVRNKVEGSMAGFEGPFSSYRELNGDIKPKYGYLRAHQEQDEIGSVDLEGYYGEDTYIFDLSKVRERITWTPGDSLNRFIDKDRRFLKENERGFRKPSFWDEAFIHWDERELMSAVLHERYKSNLYLSLSNEREFSVPKPLKQLTFGYPYPQAPYIEIQFWGKLGLEDVKEFIFSEYEPQGEFLEGLIKHKVKIFDGRERPMEEWIPPQG